MENSPYYPLTSSERSRVEEDFRVFLAEVLTVDEDRQLCTLRDSRTGIAYQGVQVFPANSSSAEATDVNMPEPGSQCICAHIFSKAGFYVPAILNWVVADTYRAVRGIATRPIDDPKHLIQGWSRRIRGNYRKPYAGQKTVANSQGYSERVDDGWDRQAADFSRDYLDPERRTWTRVTSREVVHNDAYTQMAGPVVRPGAANVGAERLPDGTTRQVVYLASGAVQGDRYMGGKSDVIAISERTTKIQEFALDFPVPAEAIGTALLDTALGVTADPWLRTAVSKTGGLSFDDQSTPITQDSDHPHATALKAVGATTNDGPTPRRRGYIIERSEGTLVGSNLFDQGTYGKILKPVLFPYTTQGRFSTNVASAYNSVRDSTDHVEARVAASALSTRFTHEGNTTRWDITKEGMLSMEIGSTLPRENIPIDGQTYEHPHGAGRSVEAHLVGSLKMVVGKNRDEEDSIDLQTLGQTVLRLGADDSSLPNARRDVQTQLRGKKDAPGPRKLQYWDQGHRRLKGLGDPGSLTAKNAGENVSLRGALDGGLVMRVGARSQQALRRHFVNGYQDARGLNPYAVDDASRIDSRSPRNAAVYPPGDASYAYHDLAQAGKPKATQPQPPYWWSGNPVETPNTQTPFMDQHGLSLDLHLVRDALLRVGKNPGSGQSLLMDLAGGVAACIGKDSQDRSLTASLDGGIELTVGPNKQGRGLRLEIRGDVDWTVYGNFSLNVTGDMTLDGTTIRQTARTDIFTSSQNNYQMALGQHIIEAACPAVTQGISVTSPPGV